jgi:RES domain-containing protein
MFVYRITKPKWAGVLMGSGMPARWNTYGMFVCYSGSSRALSCLEMLVHLNASDIVNLFKVSVIEIPDDLNIEEINSINLPKDWESPRSLHISQNLGQEWYMSQKSCVLKVPSVLIRSEFNFLINCQHPDFNKIKVHSVEDFFFDSRLMSFK